MHNKEPSIAGALAGQEVELKLRGEPKALESIFSSPKLRRKATGRSTTKHLENIYYDTPDERLRARGLAFRVRKDGRHYVQTLKSNDAVGLVAYRGEWQAPLADAEPDLALMPIGATELLADLVTADQLHSRFTTRVRRQIRRVPVSGNGCPPSLVEVALDLGTIETEQGTLPIAEVELELLEGTPVALYDLALELDAITPLHVETRSKSARGYALASGEAPAWAKAAPLELSPGMSVDQSFRAILSGCVQHWCANEVAAYHGGDPEGVHQMRVALRRLRSAFSVFGRLLDPAERADLAGGAKRIITSQGPARDLDVFLAELLAPVIAARPGDGELQALRMAAEAARATGYDAVCAEIDSPAYTRYLLQLRRWIEAAGWRAGATEEGRAWLDRPIVAFADQLLDKRHRKAIKLGRNFAHLSAEQRHQVRIALKKLRYTTEFFHALHPKSHTRPYLAALKHLQDALGHLNDVAVAESLVAILIGGARSQPERESLHAAAGLVLGWHARGVADLEPETVEAWKAFVSGKPFWH